jgi:hypothetical protein
MIREEGIFGVRFVTRALLEALWTDLQSRPFPQTSSPRFPLPASLFPQLSSFLSAAAMGASVASPQMTAARPNPITIPVGSRGVP